ncbi:MAG: pitrilysin family protein [Pyrobaculum sp.]
MERVVLPNGLVLVLDRFSWPTVALAVGVGVGSLYEGREMRGATHFLEHMLFRVPGLDVDAAVESLGGEHNAYTQRDSIILIYEALSESAADLVELAYRMYVNDKFEEGDLERERAAVLSELRQSREDPSSRVGELVLRALFGGSDWGDPVGGVPEVVEALSLKDLAEHRAKWFTPDNTMVVLSGGFSDDVVKKAVELFGRLDGKAPSKPTPSAGVGPGVIEEVGDVEGVYYAKALRLQVDAPTSLYALLHGAAFHLEVGAKSILFHTVRDGGVAYSYYVDYDVVGDVAYLAVAVESARGLAAARKAVADALRPREPPPYRLKFYKYTWEKWWRSPINRATAVAEYLFKGGDPGHMEEEFKKAAERGTSWLPPYVAKEAEAAVVPSNH